MGFILLAVPLIAVLLFALTGGRKVLHTVSVLASAIMLGAAGVLTVSVIQHNKVEYSALGGLFFVDSLSIIVLDIVLIISFMTAVYSVGYMNEDLKYKRIQIERLKIYYMLMYSFVFTMILALTVKNMGIMWIAIEATTLASAFLVGFYNNKNALEAAWKYIIICSVGIAIALLGIVFLHLSSVGRISGSALLDWTALYNNAANLNGPTLRFAFIFILIGFGTKAGLAPMHTWLPDAYSQAPTPMPLLSGVLLNCAMYGIIRTLSIVNKNLGSSRFTGTLMIAAGIFSIITAAIFIMTQKDYKRLLAYSSVEHMGIIAVAFGIFTPVSIFGGLLHMINHSFTKSMLFLSSGNILNKFGTREISKVQGLLRLLPVSGLAFLIGLFAITGAPPFSIFTSEFSIMASIFKANKFVLGAFVILLLAVVFAGVAATLFKIFYGSNVESEKLVRGETNVPGAAVIIALLVIITVTGLYMPDQIIGLLNNAQKIISGG